MGRAIATSPPVAEIPVIDVDHVSEEEAPKTLGERVREELRFFAGLVAVMLVLFTFVFGHFKIPSESMQPTLEVGDHLYVSKFAYGYSKHSLPYMLHKLPLPEGRINSKQPDRGDVVVFRNPKSGIVMIKRVVGLPGDRVQVRAGQLFLNNRIANIDFRKLMQFRLCR